MLTGRQKVVKANGAEPDELETLVAQELLNLEVCIVHSFALIKMSLQFTSISDGCQRRAEG